MPTAILQAGHYVLGPPQRSYGMASPTNRQGTDAVPFELRDTSGRLHRLQDYRGRWLLLMFHRHLA